MKTRIPRGFSLIELMIVVIIATILAALALPAFRTYFIRNNLSSSANGLLAAMNTARMEAIKRNAYVRVDPAKCSATTSWSYGAFVWIPSATNPADTAPTGPDTRIITGSPVADGTACQSGLSITSTVVSGAGNTVCYNGSGRMNLNVVASACSSSAVSAPYQVKMCDASNKVKNGPILDVSLSGRALIQPNATCP